MPTTKTKTSKKLTIRHWPLKKKKHLPLKKKLNLKARKSRSAPDESKRLLGGETNHLQVERKVSKDMKITSTIFLIF